MANDSALTSSDDATEFRSEVIEKIRQIAVRESATDPKSSPAASGDMRAAVRGMLEKFQQEIIQRNIWVRIYDDHGSDLPAFDPEACGAIERIMASAFRRHQSGRALAYVEISFLINETGTVITIEDNAPSLTAEEAEQLTFLQSPSTTVLPGGYTQQAVVCSADTRTTLGEASVRCVANCFTRFTVCFPH